MHNTIGVIPAEGLFRVKITGRPSPRVFVKPLLPVAIGNEVAVNAGQNVIMTCAGVHHVLGKQLHWWKCRVDGDCELVHTGKHIVFPAVTLSDDGDYVCSDGQIRSEPMKLIVNTNTQRPQSQGKRLCMKMFRYR